MILNFYLTSYVYPTSYFYWKKEVCVLFFQGMQILVLKPFPFFLIAFSILEKQIFSYVCKVHLLLKEDSLSLVLEELIRKLSFGGKLVIKTLDFKSLCFSYMNNALEDQKLFTLIDGIKNLSSFNFIEKIVSKNPDIRLEKIDIDQNFKIITLERIKL